MLKNLLRSDFSSEIKRYHATRKWGVELHSCLEEKMSDSEKKGGMWVDGYFSVIAEKLYLESRGLIVLIAKACPKSLRELILAKTIENGFPWPRSIVTHTQRQIYRSLVETDEGITAIFVKRKSPIMMKSREIVHAQGSVINELRAAVALNEVLQRLPQLKYQVAGESVEVSFKSEVPLGGVIDVVGGKRYSLFSGGSGILGDTLNNVEFPINGALPSSKYSWDLWDAITSGMVVVEKAAEAEGLIMNDFGVD